MCSRAPTAGVAPAPRAASGEARLRAWGEADAEALLAAAQASPDLGHQLGFMPSTVADAAELIEHWGASNLAQDLAIDLDGRACGSAGIANVNPTHGTGWVYYWVAADVRDRGLASAALAGLADWAFHTKGLFRLELGHRVDNPASCAVARAAGFAAEGIQRQKVRDGGERFDVEMHARLLTDPPARITALAVDLDEADAPASLSDSSAPR